MQGVNHQLCSHFEYKRRVFIRRGYEMQQDLTDNRSHVHRSLNRHTKKRKYFNNSFGNKALHVGVNLFDTGNKTKERISEAGVLRNISGIGVPWNGSSQRSPLNKQQRSLHPVCVRKSLFFKRNGAHGKKTPKDRKRLI